MNAPTREAVEKIIHEWASQFTGKVPNQATYANLTDRIMSALTAAREPVAEMKAAMIARVRSYEVHHRDQGLVDAIANDLEAGPLPAGPQENQEDGR